jgi:hypothetical protein
MFYEYVSKSSINAKGSKTIWIRAAGKEKERITVMIHCNFIYSGSPHLKELLVRVYSHQNTSASGERYFKARNSVFTKKRNRLKDAKFEKQSFVIYNHKSLLRNIGQVKRSLTFENSIASFDIDAFLHERIVIDSDGDSDNYDDDNDDEEDILNLGVETDSVISDNFFKTLPEQGKKSWNKLKENASYIIHQRKGQNAFETFKFNFCSRIWSLFIQAFFACYTETFLFFLGRNC